MSAGERLKRVMPLHFIEQRIECLPLSVLPKRKRLHDSIADSRKKLRCAFLQRFQNVARELAIVSALLDDCKIVDLAHPLPKLSELRSHELSEKRANTHAREIIPLPANRGASARIVPVLGMIKRLLHEPRKRDRAALSNSLANEVCQLGVQSENVQHPTSNVQ